MYAGFGKVYRMKLKLLCSAGLLALMAACSHQGGVAKQGASAQALQGFSMMRAGNVSGAEAAYRAALAVNSNDPYALLGLAMARESQGDIAGAARNYEAAQIAGRGEISTMRLVSAGVIDSDAQVGLSEYAAQGLSRIYGAPRYAEAVYGSASTYEYASGTTVHQNVVPAVSTVTSYDQGVIYSDTTGHSVPATAYQGTVGHGSVTYAEPGYVAAEPITYAAPATYAEPVAYAESSYTATGTVSYAEPVHSGGEALTYAEPVYTAAEPVIQPEPMPVPASYAEPVFAAPASSAASYGEIVYAEPTPKPMAAAPVYAEPTYTETAIAYAPAATEPAEYVASPSYETITTAAVPASYTETLPAYQPPADTGSYVASGTSLDSYTPSTAGISYDDSTTMGVIDGATGTAYAAPAIEQVEVAYGDPQPVLGGSGLLGPADYGITFKSTPGLPGGQYSVVDSGVGGAGAYSAQSATEVRTYQTAPSVVQTAPVVDDSGLELIFLGN